ncbi:MAG: hypothetical protein ACJ763_19480 [Bdellovibrionia bacterium]
MKTKSTLLMAATLLSVHAYAGADKGGNGGDICENRIKLIREDIDSWIQKGGSSGLRLPAETNLSQYNAKMRDQASKATVSCTDQDIAVGNSQKTCKNFLDDAGSPRIVCNFKRFMATPEASQYVLVHHEYAGLAGFEVNNGEESRYEISNQLTKYLQNQVVKKLAVKPVTVRAVPCSSVDLRKQKVGFVCTTSVGVRFELVEREGLGEVWMGPDQIAWTDVLGSETVEGALLACDKIGMVLPAYQNFKRGQSNKFEEVLPNLSTESNIIWSRSYRRAPAWHECTKYEYGPDYTFLNPHGKCYDGEVTKISYYSGAFGLQETTYKEDEVMLYRCVSPAL